MAAPFLPQNTETLLLWISKASDPPHHPPTAGVRRRRGGNSFHSFPGTYKGEGKPWLASPHRLFLHEVLLLSFLPHFQDKSHHASSPLTIFPWLPIVLWVKPKLQATYGKDLPSAALRLLFSLLPAVSRRIWNLITWLILVTQNASCHSVYCMCISFYPK